MKYPCILESKSKYDNRIMLAFNKNECQCINSEQMSNYCGFDFDTSDRWKNTTTEYLTNTYGKVESKEHAEFITKLAENAGFTLNEDYKSGDFFYVSATKYGFASEGFCVYDDPKLITIPLPPKSEEEGMSNEITVDVTNNTDSVVQIKKDEETKVVTVFINDLPNNGDNLLFGGEDKCNHEQFLKQCRDNADTTRKALWSDYINKKKEWPCVNSEVLTASNQKAVVKGVDGELAWIKYEKETLGYATEYICALKKPKTPEEELRDELIGATIEKMSNNSYDISFNAYYLISELMSKYDIKKKPQ